MTVINNKIVVMVSDDVRVVIGPSSVCMERVELDALDEDSWRPVVLDASTAGALADVIRRHHEAGWLDVNLLDLRPGAFIRYATEESLPRPRYVAVPVIAVPPGIEAEYATSERQARELASGNNAGARFAPEVWDKQPLSTWACVQEVDLLPPNGMGLIKDVPGVQVPDYSKFVSRCPECDGELSELDQHEACMSARASRVGLDSEDDDIPF